MARKLKLTLGDGKVYAFSTLSVMEASAVQKELAASENAVEIEEFKTLQKKMNDGGLNVAELKRFKELQGDLADATKAMGKLAACIRVSMKDHPEFVLSKDPAEDERRNAEFMKLVDMHDMIMIFQFITTGTIVKEEAIVLPPTVVDLSMKK